jgi:hypothetical protein
MVIGIAYQWYLIFPALINGAIIYFLNRFYFRAYRRFPFKLDMDNERMICYDYAFSDKKIEVRLADIRDIQGGIFGKNLTRPIYVYYGEETHPIGIHNHLKEFDNLMTIILSNISQPLYNDLLERIKNKQTSSGNKK